MTSSDALTGSGFYMIAARQSVCLRQAAMRQDIAAQICDQFTKRLLVICRGQR